MIENFQHFVSAFPDWLQWVAIVLIAAVPFVESYLGSVIGVLIGVNPVVAAVAAIAGNAASMVAVVFAASAVRRRAARGGGSTPSPKRARVRQLFDRFGVPGVSLLGHPTQISSAALIGFGAVRRSVIVWQCVSIAFWGALVAALASFGASALAG